MMKVKCQILAPGIGVSITCKVRSMGKIVCQLEF